VVQALPVLRLIKQHHPSSQIYWWLSADLLSLLEGDPDLEGIFRFERRRWASPQNWDELIRSIWRIRGHAFDWVIDLQALARSGIIAWLARGKFTIGLDDLREGAAALYDIRVARPSYYTHAVDWYLAVLPVLGVPVHRNFVWFPRRNEVAAAIQQKWKVEETRWIIINPGARWLNKRWPAEFYRQLARRIATEHPKIRIAIMGGNEDAALAEAVIDGIPNQCLNLVGKTSLAEMIEWIRMSELMVTNDTGPMHVAAALGKPVVAIFGPTEPQRTGPYGQVDRALRIPLPCAPCLKSVCTNHTPLECLWNVSPRAVFERVRDHLTNANAGA